MHPVDHFPACQLPAFPLQNFLLTLVQAYVPSLKGVTFEIADPELFPEVGIWHPLAPCMYEDLKEYLNW